MDVLLDLSENGNCSYSLALLGEKPSGEVKRYEELFEEEVDRRLWISKMDAREVELLKRMEKEQILEPSATIGTLRKWMRRHRLHSLDEMAAGVHDLIAAKRPAQELSIMKQSPKHPPASPRAVDKTPAQPQLFTYTGPKAIRRTFYQNGIPVAIYGGKRGGTLLAGSEPSRSGIITQTCNFDHNHLHVRQPYL